MPAPELDLDLDRFAEPARDPLRALEGHLLSRGRGWKTVMDYASIARRFLAYLGESRTEFADAGPKEVEAFLADYSRTWRQHHAGEREVPVATLRLYSFALRALYEATGKEATAIPHIASRPRVPRILTHRDLAELLEEAAADPLERAVFTLLAYAGLRLSELVGLETGDLNRETGVVLVRSGKGQKDRTVPLTDPEEVFAAVDAYLAVRRGDEDRVFPFGRLTAHRLIKRVADRVNARRGPGDKLPEWVSAHKFRHGWARALADRGVDAVSLQEAMGHASLETTQVYLTRTGGEVRDRIQSLGAGLYEKGAGRPERRAPPEAPVS